MPQRSSCAAEPTANPNRAFWPYGRRSRPGIVPIGAIEGAEERSATYVALFQRALEQAGSVDALAAYLGVSRVRLKSWLGGQSIPSDQMFLKLVDLLSDRPAKPARTRGSDSGSSDATG